jgi:glycosyltransferase involved in cell wall biosynthesis
MISINLTIHNKDFLIDRVLNSIKQFTRSDYEIIIVLDGCNDNSEAIVNDFFQKNHNILHKILYTPNIFETKSNNLAAKNSCGEYIIIIQDDMIVNEEGWDKRLLKPFVFDDIFAVTARTAHNWVVNDKSIHINDNFDRDDCWSDVIDHVEHANIHNLGRCTFGIRNCVNRGPLAIKKNIFDLMNGFDEEFYPQDSDDHDFCYRTYKKTGMMCGCYPINYISQDEWGGTRFNGQTKSWMLKANQKNSKILFNRHKEMMEDTKRIIENRKLI